MFIIRLAAVFVVIATFVLFGAYVMTRNKKYLTVLKQLLSYTAWFVIILVVLSIIARVIRF